MPRFSSFTKFGHLAFSGQKPLAQKLFEGMRSAMGGEENLPTDFDGSHVAASIYARAMTIATASLTVQRAANNRRPQHASVEALLAHERDFGVTHMPGASEDSRRDALRVAQQSVRGCTKEAVRTTLHGLLGSRLVAVRYLLDGEYTASPMAWYSIWLGPGTWLRPDTVQKWRTLDSSTVDGTISVGTSYLAGAADLFAPGERIVIEPGVPGRQEQTTVASANGHSITVALGKCHPSGALVTSAPWPAASSTARQLLIVVTSATARSAYWRCRISDLLYRILRPVETWAIVEETTPGILGPFKVGEGLIGITPLGTLPTVA